MKYHNLATAMPDEDTSDKTSETRDKIIESALQLFWYNGHKSTSIDEIVAAAGQSKGAFFHYFKSKKDITLIVLDKYVEEELLRPLDGHFAKYDSHKECLLSWAHELYNTSTLKKFKGGCLLGNLSLEIAMQDEELREAVARHFLSLENLLVGHLKNEAHRGTVLMETRQFARVIISSYQGLMMSIQVHQDQRRAARDFQALAELFERLIKD